MASSAATSSLLRLTVRGMLALPRALPRVLPASLPLPVTDVLQAGASAVRSREATAHGGAHPPSCLAVRARIATRSLVGRSRLSHAAHAVCARPPRQRAAAAQACAAAAAP